VHAIRVNQQERLMKKPLLAVVLLIEAGCASTTHYPPEGNVSAKDYQHVSGVYERRSAAAEAAMLVGTASVSAAAGGTAVPGNPNMRTYTVLVPNATYTMPQGCEFLDGSNP
jgi:hypothetical protein